MCTHSSPSQSMDAAQHMAPLPKTRRAVGRVVGAGGEGTRYMPLSTCSPRLDPRWLHASMLPRPTCRQFCLLEVALAAFGSGDHGLKCTGRSLLHLRRRVWETRRGLACDGIDKTERHDRCRKRRDRQRDRQDWEFGTKPVLIHDPSSCMSHHSFHSLLLPSAELKLAGLASGPATPPSNLEVDVHLGCSACVSACSEGVRY